LFPALFHCTYSSDPFGTYSTTTV